MILVDAGPLIALFDRRDAAHGRCVETLKSIDEPMATTPPVLTEAFHLLNPSSAGALNLMGFISEGGIDVLFLNEDVLMRCFELMAQYADAPMDFADASLVAMAESRNSRKVFSIDRGDFATYRIKRGHHYITFDVLG